MTDGDALLAAILAEPDEDTPRLMYADWLDEEGEYERAELIRAQIELARTPDRDAVPWNPRVAGLRATVRRILERRSAEWLDRLRGRDGPLGSEGVHAAYRRGFVEVVWMSAAWYVGRAEVLFRSLPLRELRVTFATQESFANLLACPHFPRLDTLDVSGFTLGDGLFVQLARCRAAAELRGLRARACGITDASALRLADFEYEWKPREIDVSLNAIGPAGLDALRGRYGTGVVRFDRATGA